MQITISVAEFLNAGFSLEITQKLFTQPTKRSTQKGHELISLPDEHGNISVTNWIYKSKPNIKHFYIPVEVKIIKPI